MTALPTTLYQPMTAAEYAALGESETRTELQEGSIVMSPRPTMEHMDAIFDLRDLLRDHAPADFHVTGEIDIDLALRPPDQPGTVRTPDLVVLTRQEAVDRKREKRLAHASGVVLAVEILSPGSGRMDRIVKLREYADAGIPSYWIVDLDGADGPTLTELRRTDNADDGYDTITVAAGQFETATPFPVRLDLTALSTTR